MIFGTGLSSAKTQEELLPTIQKALNSGITAFDTAPSYKTEEVLGDVLQELISEGKTQRENIWVQDKIDAWQMQESRGEVEKHVMTSLQKMGFQYFDCMLIHWPVPEYRNATLNSLFKLKDSGIIRSIGICNVKKRQLLELEEKEILPDIVQLERNPLRTCIEEVTYCTQHSITFQSYSPLCKFRDEIRNSKVLMEIAEKYNKNIGQIVMRWHIDTHSIPVFTTKKPGRIDEYTDIFHFRLSDEDVLRINGLNRNYKMYLESVLCPGF